jgi:peptidyl-prolyl cis-trans isomerase A (cyclophilin A)
MAAADRGKEEIVHILLAAGAQVNARSEQGHTALGEARTKGHQSLAALLVAAGADERLVGMTLKALLEPERLVEQAPARYEVVFETSAGPFAVAVERVLAPRGADRFYNLVKNGYFDAQRFFRVVQGWLVQFGIHGTPEVAAKWYGATIADDPVAGHNKRGALTFADGSGANSRSVQIFINLDNNAKFDRMGLVPFGAVVGDGMQVVDVLNSQYGETPEQERLVKEGNEYLQKHFPALDYIVTARLVTD